MRTLFSLLRPGPSRGILAALVPVLMALRLAAAEETAKPALLLSDDFSGMKPGMISAGVIGAQVEYHYLPLTEPRGNWTVSAFRSEGTQRAWRVLREGDQSMLCTFDTADLAERPYTHAMVVAGDDEWSDYSVGVRFAPQSDDGQSGVVFLYRHDRAYYFAGLIGQRLVLKKVFEGKAFRVLDETVLAEAPCAWKAGEGLALHVSADGGKLRAEIEGRASVEASDATFRTGRIGLTADVPTKYYRVVVQCSEEARRAFEATKAARYTEERALEAKLPAMKLWKKIATPHFGTGRNLRFGDLDGDGVKDIVIGQMRHRGPTDSHSEIECLTAITLEGKRLWQNGIPDRWKNILTNDVVFQIHDLDGDGRNEVIYARDFEIVVADGATGKTKYKAPTPEAPVYPATPPPRYPRILGDCVAFADLRGTGAPRDLLIKDRYRTLWALNDKLEPLWRASLNTGHYPYPCDLDGDGRDEVVMGYSLLAPDGSAKWSNDHRIQDHADAIAAVKFRDDLPVRILTAASDEGLVVVALDGTIVKHLQLGHVQNLSIADFRPDLPGLETVAINFWANQGVTHLLDAEQNVYRDFEPAQHGSMVLPVNWTGEPGELWCLSPNPTEGGLFDGWGRKVLRFPADGHPDYAYAVLDLTGDARDEIVVWDAWEIWIYTQSDNPKSGRLYRPKRSPAYNESNYRATVSLPGWTE